ncbi:6-aminohexanoate hydrolase [Leptolyngbya valderiana BDU 20041]|nr:6-aminohexanoate hydrolase [Leptolyngbya valderiana BDU 20041]
MLAPLAHADNDAIIDQARATDRLHALLVLKDGESVVEHVQGGDGLDRPANLKSVSKTVLSLLVGMALERGLLESVDQPLTGLLGARVPAGATPGSDRITVAHALSLQAGLQSTSGRNYGRWVQSPDWVAHILTRPMVDRPGGRMIYSTGPSHLLSAALMEAGGRSSSALARDWLGGIGVSLGYWPTDPQGVAFGGNDMHISPRDLARIGELYRQGGVLDGERVLPEAWVDASWTAYGTSPWSGDDYGYGWFITRLAGQPAYYGRGYGGQALFVLPEADLTVVVISDPNPPSSGGRQFQQVRDLVATIARTLGDPSGEKARRVNLGVIP